MAKTVKGDGVVAAKARKRVRGARGGGAVGGPMGVGEVVAAEGDGLGVTTAVVGGEVVRVGTDVGEGVGVEGAGADGAGADGAAGGDAGTAGVPAVEPAVLAQLAAAEAGGLSPLGYLLRVMRDERESPARRMDAAKTAAPFLHPKLSTMDVQSAGLDKVGGALLELIERAQGAGGGVGGLLGCGDGERREEAAGGA